MSKTKFRSLGMGFLLAALILALVTVIWPFVPQSLKSQLDAVNLPIVSEGANEASYKAAYESLLAEKESGSSSLHQVLKLLHKLQQLKQQLHNLQNLYQLQLKKVNHQMMLPTN